MNERTNERMNDLYYMDNACIEAMLHSDNGADHAFSLLHWLALQRLAIQTGASDCRPRGSRPTIRMVNRRDSRSRPD